MAWTMSRKPHPRKRRKNERKRKERAREFRPPSAAPGDLDFIDIIVGLSGEPAHGLYDDCPLCRELRESGVPVFTLDEYGELVPMDTSGSPGSRGSLN